MEQAHCTDERHRIPLAMRCLLIEHSDGLILVDTALGNKESSKFHDIYGVENEGLEGATQLEDALASAGYLPADVRWVINTHLHFDHAGGNTTIDPTLADDPRRHVRPTYPNATFMVQKNEVEFARHTNERTRASYLSPNFEPVAAAKRWRLLEGDGEVLLGQRASDPGPRAMEQAVLIRDLADCCIHGPLPHPHHGASAVAVDHGLRPGAAPDAGDGSDPSYGTRWRGVRLIFEHDATVVSGVAVEEGKDVVLRGVVEAPKRVALDGGREGR